jgi:hypothetical protein
LVAGMRVSLVMSAPMLSMSESFNMKTPAKAHT